MEPSKKRYSILKGPSNESKIDQNKLARKVRFSTNFVKGFTTSEDGNHTKWESTYEEDIDKSTPSHQSNIEVTQQSWMNTLLKSDTSEDSASFFESTSSNSPIVNIKGVPTFLENAKNVVLDEKQSPVHFSNLSEFSETFSSPDFSDINNFYKNSSICSSLDDDNAQCNSASPQTEQLSLKLKSQPVKVMEESTVANKKIQSCTSDVNQTRYDELSMDQSISIFHNKSESQNKRVSRLGEITKIFDADDDDFAIEETQKLSCYISSQKLNILSAQKSANKTKIFDHGCMEETNVLSTTIHQNKENVLFECTKLFLGNDDALMEETKVLSPTIYCHSPASIQNSMQENSEPLTVDIPEILRDTGNHLKTVNMENIRPKSLSSSSLFQDAPEHNASLSKNQKQCTKDQQLDKSKVSKAHNISQKEEVEKSMRKSCNKRFSSKTEIFDPGMDIEETECLTDNIIQAVQIVNTNNITKNNANATNLLDQNVKLDLTHNVNDNMNPITKFKREKKNDTSRKKSFNKSHLMKTKIFDEGVDMDETKCMTGNIIQKETHAKERKMSTTHNTTVNKSVLRRTKIFDDGADMEETKSLPQNLIQNNPSKNITNTTIIFDQEEEMEETKCMTANINPNSKMKIEKKSKKTPNISMNKTIFTRTKIFDEDADMEETKCVADHTSRKEEVVEGRKNNKSANKTLDKSIFRRTQIFDDSADIEETKSLPQNLIQHNRTKNINVTKIFDQDEGMEETTCMTSNINHNLKKDIEERNKKSPNSTINKGNFTKTILFDQDANMEETKCATDNVSRKSNVLIEQKRKKSSNTTFNKSILTRTKIFDQDEDVEETTCLTSNINHNFKMEPEPINNKTLNASINKSTFTRTKIFDQDADMEETKCATDNVSRKSNVLIEQKNRKSLSATSNKSILRSTKIFDQTEEMEETKSLTRNIFRREESINKIHQNKTLANHTCMTETKSFPTNIFQREDNIDDEISNKNITKATKMFEHDSNIEETKCSTDTRKSKDAKKRRLTKGPCASITSLNLRRSHAVDEDSNIEEASSLTLNLIGNARALNETNQTKNIKIASKVNDMTETYLDARNINEDVIKAKKENPHKSFTNKTLIIDQDVDIDKTNYISAKRKESASKLASRNKTTSPVSAKRIVHNDNAVGDQTRSRSLRKALNEIPQSTKVMKQHYNENTDTDIIEVEDDLDKPSSTKPILPFNRQIFKDDPSNKENQLRTSQNSLFFTSVNAEEARKTETSSASCSNIHMAHELDDINISGVDKLLDSQIITITDTFIEPSMVIDISDSEVVEKVKILQNIIVSPADTNLSTSSSMGLIDDQSLESGHSAKIMKDLKRKYVDDPILNQINCPDNTDWSVYNLNISDLQLNLGEPENILIALRIKRELKAAIKGKLEKRFKLLQNQASITVSNLSERKAELEATYRNFIEVKSLPKEVLEKTLIEQIKFKAINHFTEYKILELTTTSVELSINIPKCDLIIIFEENTGIVKRLERRDCFLEDTKPYSDYITNFTHQILSATLIRPALGRYFSVLSVQDYLVMHFSSLSDVLDNLCYMWMMYASKLSPEFRQSYRYLTKRSFVEVEFNLSGFTPKKITYKVIVHYGRVNRHHMKTMIANVTRDSQFLQNACNLCDEYLSSLET